MKTYIAVGCHLYCQEDERTPFTTPHYLIPIATFDENSVCKDAATALNFIQSETSGLRKALKSLAYKADNVMKKLEKWGPSIVPHLMDTDDNDGQYLREAIERVKMLVGPLDRE